MPNYISVHGARVNNLKNIDVDIPRDKLVVITGLSGSGKSSLAFDTVYAEGHRRFVESLSSYARMFIGQMDKPDVDSIEGLSPAISIDQKTTSKNPRSTVGTVTEIYDYLRLLYARLGVPHCPVCGKEIRQTSQDTIIDKIMEFPEGERFMILAPIVRGKKGRHEKILANAKKNGYARVRADGILYDLGDDIPLDKNLRHTIEIVIDRLVMKPDIRVRLSDSVECAVRESDGSVTVVTVPREGEAKEYEFSTNYACPEHGVSFGELEPRMFSFNNPFGACPTCTGLGVLRSVDPDKIIPDKSLALSEGAVAVNGFKTLTDDSWNGPLILAAIEKYGANLDMPLKDYPKAAYDVLLHGSPDEFNVVRHFGGKAQQQTIVFEGILRMIENRAQPNAWDHEYYEQFLTDRDCPECHGAKLNHDALGVTVGGKNIYEFCSMSVTDALEFTNALSFSESEMTVAREILKELKSRLGFLNAVGLNYLTLARKSATLSGGEAQRIRLATQIGSSLAGVLYILDEPSIGLHQRDNGKLIRTLKSLRDLGNSVIVVEHDEETMQSADYIIDIGPAAGVHATAATRRRGLLPHPLGRPRAGRTALQVGAERPAVRRTAPRGTAERPRQRIHHGRHPPRRPGAENRRLPPAQIRVAGTAEIVPDSPQTGAIHHRRPGKGRKTDPAAGRPLRQARRRARGAVDPPRVRRFVRADLDHRLQPHTAAYDPRQGGRRICAFHGRERGGDAGECNGNGCRGRPGQRIGRKPARECGNGRGCGTDGGKNTGTDRDCGRGSDRRASRGIAGGRTRAAAFGTSPGTGACRRTSSRTRRQRGTPRGCSIGRRTAMRRTKTMLMGDLLEEFFKRPYVAAKVAEGKLPDTWREIVGDRAAEITTELKIENHILYARIQSSVLRSELFYQREALKEEINRRSGVRLVNAVIIR